MAKTTTLPFVCRSCGRRYGDGPEGILLAIDGDASDVSLTDNFMQCQCGQMNRQALPNGTYNVRGGRWEVARQITQDILSVPATQADIAQLAELIKEARAKGANDEQIAASIESQTPFAPVAQRIRQFARNHPPGWGTALLIGPILGVILPMIIRLVLGMIEPVHPAAPPAPPVVHLSQRQVYEIAQQVANDLEKQHLHFGQRAGKPQRNERCSCGSGVKYKKCCGDPTERTRG